MTIINNNDIAQARNDKRMVSDAGTLVQEFELSGPGAAASKQASAAESPNTANPGDDQGTAKLADGSEEQDLVGRARLEAEERVAELHLEEGTVLSEGGQNSPRPGGDGAYPERSAEILGRRSDRLGEQAVQFVQEEPLKAVALMLMASAALTAVFMSLSKRIR